MRGKEPERVGGGDEEKQLLLNPKRESLVSGDKESSKQQEGKMRYSIKNVGHDPISPPGVPKRVALGLNA